MISSLSSRQQTRLFLTLVACAAIVIVGMGRQSRAGSRPVPVVRVEMPIRAIAPALDVTGKSLAKELGLPLGIDKRKPLAELGVGQDRLDHVAEHILGHREATLKYYVFAALVLFGLVYLAYLGRPDGSPVGDRRAWYPRWPYITCLLVAVVLCGFVLGKSPNPMEAAVKVFKSMVGLYPSVADKVLAFCFFAALATVGSKLICGWACPFGALQELLYHMPLPRGMKKWRIPFVVTNTVRGVLFAAMLLLLFGVVGGRRGFVLYHFVNPFNLFNLDFEGPTVAASVLVALVVSLGFYRPFCQFVCPFGLLSWLLERISLFRVRIDHDRCIDCGACGRACPLRAAADRVARKRFPADCFSCGRCLNACPADAIHYGCRARKAAGRAEPKPESDV